MNRTSLTDVSAAGNTIAAWCGMRDVRDAIMQRRMDATWRRMDATWRRMDATWRRQVADRSAFKGTKVINWAAYQATLTVRNERITWEHAPEGIWPIEVYLDMLAGEVTRLSDDEQGYGPRGKDFVSHVDVPQAVLDASMFLSERA